jgi:hypothetical protein
MRSSPVKAIRMGSAVEYLHRDFTRLARQLKRTRDRAEKDRLLKQMVDIQREVDSLIAHRPHQRAANSLGETVAPGTF